MKSCFAGKIYKRMVGALAVLTIILSGCGSAPRDVVAESKNFMEMKEYGYAVEDMEAEAVFTDSVTMSTASDTGYAGNRKPDKVENDLAVRKLIRDMNLTVETKEFDRFMVSLEQQIADHGGYIQNGETSGSAQTSYSRRWANYTIRIPEDRYEDFVSSVSSLGNVTYKNESVQDVTMAYTDVESHIRALETEYETLLAILEKCTELDDVITVQSRITEVNYALDSYKSRLRQYDDLISYCTVYLSVAEVERITQPVVEKTLGQRIAEELSDTCEDITEDAESFAVWFVSSLPYFGIWIVVLGIIAILAVLLLRHSSRKLAQRQAKRAALSEEKAKMTGLDKNTDKTEENHDPTTEK